MAFKNIPDFRAISAAIFSGCLLYRRSGRFYSRGGERELAGSAGATFRAAESLATAVSRS